jgi:hypothetical protein
VTIRLISATLQATLYPAYQGIHLHLNAINNCSGIIRQKILTMTYFDELKIWDEKVIIR